MGFFRSLLSAFSSPLKRPDGWQSQPSGSGTSFITHFWDWPVVAIFSPAQQPRPPMRAWRPALHPKSQIRPPVLPQTEPTMCRSSQSHHLIINTVPFFFSFFFYSALVVSVAAAATEQPTQTREFNAAKNPKTGVRGAPSLHRAELPFKQSMRRRATPGTHGGDVSNRVMADAVGRRGHFSQGRCSPDFDSVALVGNDRAGAVGHRRAHGNLNAPPKAGDGNQEQD